MDARNEDRSFRSPDAIIDALVERLSQSRINSNLVVTVLSQYIMPEIGKVGCLPDP